MKLWHSFKKEVSLASKSWYFYIEVGMALILLLILLLFVPEDFSSRSEDYLYPDLPPALRADFEKGLAEEVLGPREAVSLKAGGQSFPALLYKTEEADLYLLDSMAALRALVYEESKQVTHLYPEDNDLLVRTFYLQGYETDKLISLIRLSASPYMASEAFKAYSEDLPVRQLRSEGEILSDRENIVPVFLTYNGSLMSLFIIAAYIFLDKKAGVIKAYAVTASSVAHYLLSKIGVILLTSLVTTLIVTVPLMGTQPRYGFLLLFLLTSGFFMGAVGLYLSSFYEDVVQSFGALYMVIMLMMLPNISYFIPSWDPVWIKLIPSYLMLMSFREIISLGGNMTYVVLSSFFFLFLGLDVFLLANRRFMRTLS